MTHRAEQVIDTVVSLLQDAAIVSSNNVFAHRSLSLAEDQGEIPAICVNFGEDNRLDEFGHDSDDDDAEIDSVLTVNLTLYVKDVDEPKVKLELMRIRAAVHVALLTDPTLGEEFIVVTRYGGASEPTLDSSSESIVGMMVTPFLVHYRMAAANPA